MEQGGHEDADVQPKAPVLHIPYIGMYTILQWVVVPSLRAETLCLFPACDAWLCPMAYQILVCYPAILFGMSREVRTRSHQGQVAKQDVDEERQFADMRFAQPFSKGKVMHAALCTRHIIAFGMKMLCTEQKAMESIPIQSTAFLP